MTAGRRLEADHHAAAIATTDESRRTRNGSSSMDAHLFRHVSPPKNPSNQPPTEAVKLRAYLEPWRAFRSRRHVGSWPTSAGNSEKVSQALPTARQLVELGTDAQGPPQAFRP